MPASSARWMMRMLSSWSGLPQLPNIIAPRQSGETFRPVLPRFRYSMLYPRYQSHTGGTVSRVQQLLHLLQPGVEALEHEVAALGGGQGRAEEVALKLVAAEPLEPAHLLLLLDPLGDHVDLQAHGEGDHRRRHLLAAAGLADGVHEGAVELEGVDREGGEIGERGVAGAEVVDGDPHPQLLEAAQDGERRLGVLPGEGP